MSPTPFLQRRSDNSLRSLDIRGEAHGDTTFAAPRATLLAQFHVQRADGSRSDGAQALVAMWKQLPGILALVKRACRGFLKLRSWLQAFARR